MKMYKPRAADITAFRLGCDSTPDWFKELIMRGLVLAHLSYENDTTIYACIMTELHRTVASGDDYIVRDSEGHVFPMESGIFETLFERKK